MHECLHQLQEVAVRALFARALTVFGSLSQTQPFQVEALDSAFYQVVSLKGGEGATTSSKGEASPKAKGLETVARGGESPSVLQRVKEEAPKSPDKELKESGGAPVVKPEEEQPKEKVQPTSKPEESARELRIHQSRLRRGSRCLDEEKRSRLLRSFHELPKDKRRKRRGGAGEDLRLRQT